MTTLADWCRANPHLAAMKIEQLEAALRAIWLQNIEPYAREIARVALTQSSPPKETTDGS